LGGLVIVVIGVFLAIFASAGKPEYIPIGFAVILLGLAIELDDMCRALAKTRAK
jgi:predicted signal transduction protein with EAL and GGDEF domain